MLRTMNMNKKRLNDVVKAIKTPLGVALLLGVLLAIIVLTPKEVLPDVLLIVRSVLGILLIDVGTEIL